MLQTNKFIQLTGVSMIQSGKGSKDISLLSIDRIQQPPVDVAQIFLYPQTLDPGLLKESLSQLLKDFPVFSGRLISDDDGNLSVKCNDRGVKFTEARSLHSLNNFKDRRAISRFAHLYADLVVPQRTINNDVPLLSIKLTQLIGGGSLLGITNSHSICDIVGMYGFLIAWSDLINKKVYQKPLFDRSILAKLESGFSGSSPSGYENYHFMNSKQDVQLGSNAIKKSISSAHGVFHYTTEEVNNMKADALKELTDLEKWISTQDAFAAHIWREIALSNEDLQKMYLCIVANFRNRKGFELPFSFIGNAITTRVIQTDITECRKTESLLYLAQKIRQASNTVNTETVGLDLAYLTKQYRVTNVGATVNFVFEHLNEGLSLNNLSGLSFYDVDLGTGKPCWYNPPVWPLYRIVHITTAPDNDGFIVHMRLPQQEMDAFSERYKQQKQRCVI